MFLLSMPNLVTSASLVDRATKCLAMCDSSGAVLRNQFLAVMALVVVSCVVKVLDATRNRVVSGSESRRASVMWVPSTLETKCMVRLRSPYGFSASDTMTGPLQYE